MYRAVKCTIVGVGGKAERRGGQVKVIQLIVYKAPSEGEVPDQGHTTYWGRADKQAKFSY